MRKTAIVILAILVAATAFAANRDSLPGNPDAVTLPADWSADLGGGTFVVQDQRAVTVYDDIDAFLAILAPGYYFEDFAGIGYGDITGPSYQFGPVNGYSYTCSAVEGLYSVIGAMSTNAPLDPLVIEFDGLPVTGVGGDFFCTDFDGNPVTEPITVTTDDGTEVTLTYPSVFAGFTSDEAITSLTLSTTATGSVFVTFDNFYVGEVGTVAAEATPLTQVKALFD
ncbi:hypothetical protein GF314_12410 [bacterium]|nr:hypothetical protein [bacterium]